MPLTKLEIGGPEMPGGSVLIHGIFNTGKTKLAGAAAKYFSTQGKVMIASMAEEHGLDSIADLGLNKEDLGYQAIYECDSYEDVLEFLTLVEKDKPIAVAWDSLWALYRLIQKKTTGGNRPPVAGKNDKNEWPQIHNDAHNLMTRARKCARWNIWTCPSDTGQNIIKEVESGGVTQKVKVTPDLNGKLAEGCISWFNLVGYLMLDEVKKGNKVDVVRTLSFDKSVNYVTRQRLPYPVSMKITIPENDPIAGWAKVMELANESYAKAYALRGKK